MDLRFTLRALRRSPWFSSTAIATIALSIALASTVFAVVDGVLFKPLPYPQSDRLFFMAGDAGPNGGTAVLAPADLHYLRSADPRIQITSYRSGAQYVIAGHADTPISARRVEMNFFDVLGVRPLVGGFSAEHFAAIAPNAPIPAVITHVLWKDRLGGDASIVGRTIDVIGQRLLVVGVLPSDFLYPGSTLSDVFLPLVFSAQDSASRWSRSLSSVVRVGTDITIDEARDRLNATLAPRVGEYPPRPNNHPGPYVGVRLSPLTTSLGSAQRPLFSVAFGGAALLIVLGAINVAGLLAARGRDRERELSVRLAIGATRRNLVRLLMTEALVVAVAGGALGVWLAVPLLRLAVSLLPASLLSLKPVEIDWRVVAFALAAPVIALSAFALIPVLRSTRRTLVQRVAGGATSTERVRSWGRGVLLAAESAIGIALVVEGSLVLVSFVVLRATDPGIDTERLAILEPRSARTLSADERRAFYQDLLLRTRQSPGVERAAMIGIPLLQNSYGGFRFKIPEDAIRTHRFYPQEVPISGDFFDLAQLRVLDGRVMSAAEIDAQRPYAVVSETLARIWWPGRRAVGQTLSTLDAEINVIGIVEDVRFSAQDAQDLQIYVPMDPARPLSGFTAYLLRTSGDPDSIAKQTAIALQRQIPGMFIPRAESFDAALFKSVRMHQFRTVLFAVAGSAALLLLAVGVGGLVASNTARRAREIGIRAALGARRRQLERMVVAEHLRPSMLGLALGLLMSWWTTKLVSAFLYEIDAHEPIVWTAALAVVLIIVALAAWIPARRAASVDPMVVLRTE